MSYNTATPYIASYIIVRKGGKIAFVLRENTAWMNGYYGLPAGKVEKNETFKQAAVREAKEETGIDVAEADIRYVHTMHRKSDDNSLYWVDVFFEADRWNGEVVNAEPEMHSEVAWLDPQDLPENIIPNVREAIVQITKGATYSELGWQ